MSIARVEILQNLLGTKSVPVPTVIDCVPKAWVLFNGSGTLAISASSGVSSVTDNGTGDYTVNFTNPFADALYGVTYGCPETSGGSRSIGQNSGSVLKTTTAIRLLAQINSSPGDLDGITVVFVR